MVEPRTKVSSFLVDISQNLAIDLQPFCNSELLFLGNERVNRKPDFQLPPFRNATVVSIELKMAFLRMKWAKINECRERVNYPRDCLSFPNILNIFLNKLAQFIKCKISAAVVF